jgi:hypothetical protein
VLLELIDSAPGCLEGVTEDANDVGDLVWLELLFDQQVVEDFFDLKRREIENFENCGSF